MGDMNLMLNDYRLTTAEILYRMPDHENLLQTFIWQELDRIPDFPRLRSPVDVAQAAYCGCGDRLSCRR